MDNKLTLDFVVALLLIVVLLTLQKQTTLTVQAINPKGLPLDKDKLKTFTGLENLTEEEAEKTLTFLDVYTTLVYMQVVKLNNNKE